MTTGKSPSMLAPTGFTSGKAISTKRMCSPCARRESDLASAPMTMLNWRELFPFSPDYVALGPIYPTKLKAMAFAPQGLETIGVWKRRIGAIPLVAIGGLDVERAKLCLAAGADMSPSSLTSRSTPIRSSARANG